MDLTVANKGDGNNDNNYNNNNENMLRDYRKGNWNLQETMVLIEAKKMDDERRMRRLAEINERGKPAELRWKWVEDYCWKNGCLRSQNQCNDKWDNLMRDFKKVRDYQKKRMAGDDDGDDKSSYWRIDKNERKDNNLPANMLPQIYEALVEVVERKGQMSSGGAAGCSSAVSLPAVAVVGKTNSRILGHHQHTFLPSSPILQQYSNIVQAPAILVAPPPADQTPEDTPRGAVPNSSPPLPTNSDTSEYSGSPAKRRKRGGGGEGSGGAGRTIQELGSAISTIAEAIQSSEEREERRHREVMSVHERRLQIEESKAEMNRQGINGTIDAIHKLAESIFALAANK
ncbi:hypothetical protein OROGR_002881 [Orobanche gracilis]